MDGAFAPRVLRFDGPCGPKGCGIAAFGGDEYILLPGAAKTVQPPFRAGKMHPFCRLAATSSPEGQILAALCLELLMSAEAESRANFPLRRSPRRGIGMHFHRAKPGCMVFPASDRRHIKFIAAATAIHNPRAKGPSNLRTLRTFGPHGPSTLTPERACPKPPQPFFSSPKWSKIQAIVY